MPSVRVRGASVSVVASSSLPRAAAADAVRPADARDKHQATDAPADQSAQPADDGDLIVCRTNEQQGTTGSGTGASRSGQRSPDDVIGSPGHRAGVVPSHCTPVQQ